MVDLSQRLLGEINKYMLVDGMEDRELIGHSGRALPSDLRVRFPSDKVRMQQFTRCPPAVLAGKCPLDSRRDSLGWQSNINGIVAGLIATSRTKVPTVLFQGDFMTHSEMAVLLRSALGDPFFSKRGVGGIDRSYFQKMLGTVTRPENNLQLGYEQVKTVCRKFSRFLPFERIEGNLVMSSEDTRDELKQLIAPFSELLSAYIGELGVVRESSVEDSELYARAVKTFLSVSETPFLAPRVVADKGVYFVRKNWHPTHLRLYSREVVAQRSQGGLWSLIRENRMSGIGEGLEDFSFDEVRDYICDEVVRVSLGALVKSYDSAGGNSSSHALYGSNFASRFPN